ncbi:RNA polymerase sigma factor [Salinactinospora qingdaonensis]
MTDRELAKALRSPSVSPTRACGRLFDVYGEELYQRCLARLRDPDVAQTALRDTFVVAYSHIHHLPDPCQLRDWLVALADAECERHRPTIEAAEVLSPPAQLAAGGSSLLRLRVLSGITAPELAGYRAHVARRAARFGRDGFPLAAGQRPRARPSSYVLPGLVVAFCAVVLVTFVLIELAGLGPTPLSALIGSPGPLRPT